MRRLCLIFLLFIFYNAHGQSTRAQKFAIDSADWITDDLEGSLTFYKNGVKDETLKDRAVVDFGLYTASGKFKVVKDTLTITHEYEGADNLDTVKRHRVEKFSFLIKHLDKQYLVLAPVVKQKKGKPTEADLDSSAYTDYAGRTRNPQPEYYFENLKYATDKSFKFKQLYFKPSPGLTIQIDSRGSYYVNGDRLEDNKYNGSFKGELSGKQLDTLNNLLKRSQVKKLQNWPSGRFNENANEYDLQIDYADEKLVVKTDVWPICINELIVFLEESYKKVTLVPIKVGKE